MGKATKIWLIIAASLVVLGLIAFAVVMTANHWDFSKLGTVKYETNTYEISEEFNNILINTKTADIIFFPSDDEKCKVVCYEQQNMKHSVAVVDGALTVNVVDTREWYDNIVVFSFTSPDITVYLPQAEYASLLIEASTGDIEIPKDFKFEGIDVSAGTGDVKCCASASELIKIKLSTGDICVENVSAGTLDLSVSTGDVTASSITCEGDVAVSVTTGDTKLTDVACKSVASSGSTGDITLKNVIATETFSIERSTGDVKFDCCDAAEIFVNADTGDVTGTLLSEKVFIARADTGSVDVPKTVTGGRCEVTTDTGDIDIRIN